MHTNISSKIRQSFQFKAASSGVMILGGLLASLPLAHGASVFGNGDLSSTANDIGGFTFNANQAWAVPFTTGGSSGDDLELDAVTALVGDANTGLTFSAEIYADAGTNGGPDGSPLATGSATIGAGPLAWQSVSFSSTITLNPNTNYYFAIVRGAGGSTAFEWEVPLLDASYSNQGSGSSYAVTPVVSAPQTLWRRFDGNWVDSTSTVSSNEVGYQLNAVPEPSTALLSLGTIAFLFRRRR